MCRAHTQETRGQSQVGIVSTDSEGLNLIHNIIWHNTEPMVTALTTEEEKT
jgi:hypothetical protein